ncbi:unnamed protein product, partial [Mesorhabditis belari]|uniref:Uncharacterized protein n=1 Tax=Mesorhabditis belari TaxID=2138241 RepID=A0AAF3ETF9_9BILA
MTTFHSRLCAISIVESEESPSDSSPPTDDRPIEVFVVDTSDSTPSIPSSSTSSSSSRNSSISRSRSPKKHRKLRKKRSVSKKSVHVIYKSLNHKRRIRKNTAKRMDESVKRIVMKSEKESSERMKNLNRRLENMTQRVRLECEQLHQRMAARRNAIQLYSLAQRFDFMNEDEDLFFIIENH